MAVIIQLRRDSAANWLFINPILAEGEVGLELDTGKRKTGDGLTAWSLLPYDLGSLPTNYTHTQSIAASTWTINHNLGYKPGGIMVFDSANTPWFGSVTHLDDNTLTIDFGAAVFGGKAYLS